jgi:hypothetical protein
MSRLRLALVAVLALAALTVGTATAAAAPVQFVGGWTTLTTDPATTSVLVQNGILPQAVAPGSVRPAPSGALSLQYSFPITGGSADLSTLAGQVQHSGGIRFVNVANGRSLLVSDFVIDTAAGQLTAAVNGNPNVRVPILDLDLSKAKIRTQFTVLRVNNVGATLTATAAGALNASLGVSFFAAGIKLGTADVYAFVAGSAFGGSTT